MKPVIPPTLRASLLEFYTTSFNMAEEAVLSGTSVRTVAAHALSRIIACASLELYEELYEPLPLLPFVRRRTLDGTREFTANPEFRDMCAEMMAAVLASTEPVDVSPVTVAVQYLIFERFAIRHKLTITIPNALRERHAAALLETYHFPL